MWCQMTALCQFYNLKNLNLQFLLNDRKKKKKIDIQVPRKEKYVRVSHMAFLNRALSKEKMTRTRLRENVLEDGSEEKKMKYSKQCNYCVSILRK